MSGLKINIATDSKRLNSIIRRFPDANVGTRSGIAKQGRLLLRNDFLSGQELDLKPGDKDKAGRNMVSGRVGRRGTIVFASYPMNLYERGRKLRSGRKEAGKFVITRKFKSHLDSRLQGIANEEARKTFQKLGVA